MKIDTASEARTFLQDKNVDALMYSVGPPTSSECVVIEEIDGVWCTYYWERGQKEPITKHKSEKDAVALFLWKVSRVSTLSGRMEFDFT